MSGPTPLHKIFLISGCDIAPERIMGTANSRRNFIQLLAGGSHRPIRVDLEMITLPKSEKA